MLKFYGNGKNETVLTSCPSCGSDAVMSNSGMRCTNTDCEKS